jgi:hypothetical protein
MCRAGFCGKFYYALDVTHPGARKHIADTVIDIGKIE